MTLDGIFTEKQCSFKISDFKQWLPLTIELNVILICFYVFPATLMKTNFVSLKECQLPKFLLWRCIRKNVFCCLKRKIVSSYQYYY